MMDFGVIFIMQVYVLYQYIFHFPSVSDLLILFPNMLTNFGFSDALL